MQIDNTLNIYLDIHESFFKKAKYVFSFFGKCLGKEIRCLKKAKTGEIHIYYGSKANDKYPLCIYHDQNAVAFFNNKIQYPDDKLDFFVSEQYRHPFLFSKKGDVCTRANNFMINKDIISSAFYFLSCWQEYIEDLEQGESYDFNKSMQCLHDFAETPVVDLYCQILQHGLEMCYPYFKKKSLWGKSHTFTLSLSHDIDYFDYWSKSHLRNIYKHNFYKLFYNPLSAIYKGLGHFLTKQFFWNAEKELGKIYKKEDLLSCKSTSFIMVKSDGKDDRHSYFQDNTTKEKLKKIYQNRSVGLHGSKEASYDLDALKEELRLLKSLGFDVKGYRNHYLYFNYQKTFAILEQARFEYDSTLGYSENIGFRAGTSMPFQPYNIMEDRPFNIIEIPLIVMDATLYSDRGMKLPYHQAKLKLFRLIHRATLSDGHISLLWHNNTFEFIDFTFWGKLYWDAIKYAKSKNALISSVEEVSTLNQRE